MNKAHLAQDVSEHFGIPHQAARELVEFVFDDIVRSVVRGDRVSITGFGSFVTASRAERSARNPQTGERMRIPERNVVKFNAGQNFTDLVNGVKELPENSSSLKKKPKSTNAQNG